MSGIPFSHRIQEWLADRVSWVQYPRQQYIPRQGAGQPAVQFKYAMPWWQRIALIQFGILMIVIALPLLGLGVLILWSLFSVVFQ